MFTSCFDGARNSGQATAAVFGMALEILAVKALENPLCLVLVQGDLQSTLKGDWMALEGINHRPRAVAILLKFISILYHRFLPHSSADLHVMRKEVLRSFE
ncbi:hypothetical protein [Brucella oryzae]|uniref:hypothetical protein n=1 Tax=Brucella oryzae TaxID=335286 RepID=UPI00142D7945|nr:hypothetical protein [Brucella oryzae]